MELEVVGEDVVAEPDLGVGVEQSLVIVVSHPTSVLHLADHVPDRRPRHALHDSSIAKCTLRSSQQTVKRAITPCCRPAFPCRHTTESVHRYTPD